MWVTKLLISPVKKRIFCPKTTKFGPKLAFLVSLGQAMQAFSVPCWRVGYCLWRAGCISQDNYLLYCISCSDDAEFEIDTWGAGVRCHLLQVRTELHHFFLHFFQPIKKIYWSTSGAVMANKSDFSF